MTEATGLLAFENWVIGALGGDPSPSAIEEWANAYRAHSQRLLTERPATSGLSSGGGALDAALGLVYGARTFWVAQHLLAAFKPGPGIIIELGSGFGPFGLAAALQDRERVVRLVDASADRLAFGRRVFHVAQLGEPEVEVGDLRSANVSGAGAVALPFALNELGRGVDDGARMRAVEGLLRRLLGSLGPDGLLYVLEPGTFPEATFLEGLRDRLASHVVAPCTGATGCPRLGGRDWCHFTWPMPVGPTTRLVADRAGRRHQETHFSWLVLAAAPRPPGSESRVLENQLSGPGKRTLRVCSSSGELVLTSLRRSGEVEAVVRELRPGDTVVVDPTACTPKGDGLRIQRPEALTLSARVAPREEAVTPDHVLVGE